MIELNKVVVFMVGNEEYALPIESVVAIEKNGRITSIPHFPDFVAGMTRIRNELLPLIDVHQVLYPGKMETDTSEQKVIVIKTDVMSMGLIVKAAREILDVADATMNQIGLIGYRKTQYMLGVANINERLITIIDPQKFISSLEGIKELQEYMHSHQ